MAPTSNIINTLGALLAGGLTSIALSAVVGVQGFLYFRLYPQDSIRMKGLVASVWLLDAIHSVLIAVAIWKYFVLSFGDANQADFIYLEVALTVAITAALTYVVHMFFALRVYRLSKSNWAVAAIIGALALARLASALGTTVKMSELRSYSRFVDEVSWVFTLGLALSTATDIMITLAMCFFLQNSRTGFGKMDDAIGILLIYSFNNGVLTCVATITAMICWITMHTNNLIFFGIHFCIAKLYAMSLMITLNTRHSIRRRAQSSGEAAEYPMSVRFPESFGNTGSGMRLAATRFPSNRRPGENGQIATQISVNIEKTIHYDVDDTDRVSDTHDQPTSASPLNKHGDHTGL